MIWGRESRRGDRPGLVSRRRLPTPRGRGRFAAGGLAVAGALALSPGCGAVNFVNELSEPQLDIERMEADIGSQLQRELENRSRTTSSSVASYGRVRCRQRSEFEATCFAREKRRSSRRLRKLTVFVDSDTGLYRWEFVR